MLGYTKEQIAEIIGITCTESECIVCREALRSDHYNPIIELAVIAKLLDKILIILEEINSKIKDKI